MIRADAMPRLCTLLLAAGLLACGDDLPSESESDEAQADVTTGFITTGSESSSSSSSSSSESSGSTEGGTFGAVDECDLSPDCEAGLVCVAPFDESLGPEGKGLNACVSDCVGPMDETRWCADAIACCDPAAECTDRGYCVVPGESGDSGESSGGSGENSGGSGSEGTTGE